MLTQYLHYDAPPVCQRDALRYAGCRAEADDAAKALFASCLAEANEVLRYTACYTVVPCTVTGDVCDLHVFTVTSRALAKHLGHCDRAVIMAATLGTPFDRLLLRYSRLKPSRAAMLQAIGTERVETLLDTLCADIERREGMFLGDRFSPGYADVPLTVQPSVFAALDCEKRLGITLTDSLLMSPSKSVTAVAPLTAVPTSHHSKCSRCTNTACAFRGDT